MEDLGKYKNLTRKKIDDLYETGCDPQVLDQVAPILTNPEEYPLPVKAVFTGDYFQFWWESQNHSRDNYDDLCISMGHGGLTLSVEHRHTESPFPSIPPEITAERIAFLTEPGRNSLHQTYLFRAGTPGAIDGAEALELFQPRFDHALRNLGLQAARLEDFSNYRLNEAI